MRDEDAAVADLTNQGAEGLLVALFRSIHQCPEHPLPLVVRRQGCTVDEHECEHRVNRSILAGDGLPAHKSAGRRRAGPRSPWLGALLWGRVIQVV